MKVSIFRRSVVVLILISSVIYVIVYVIVLTENCDRHRVAETIAALHQPHDQSMASPAGMRGPTTRSTYRTLLLNIVVTMSDIDDLLIYHPNIILTSDMYDILDNMHKYLCN